MTLKNKQFMVLDAVGNPLARRSSSEANPFIFYSLMMACKFAEEELATDEINTNTVKVVEIKTLEEQGKETSKAK